MSQCDVCGGSEDAVRIAFVGGKWRCEPCWRRTPCTSCGRDSKTLRSRAFWNQDARGRGVICYGCL